MKTFKLLTLLLIVTFFSNCTKEVDLFNPTSTPGIKNPWANMAKTPTDVFGLIIDKNNQPIANADITVGNKTTTTDKNGFFIITKASVVKEHIYVQSQKTGYFNASRVLSYTTKDRAQVTIMMLENQKVADFQANTGGYAEVNGLKVKFPAGGYKYQNGGAVYTGKVNVSMNYLDPTDPKIMLTMPGDLTAVNTNGEIKFLQTFGMTNVEMTDDNGKLLQLATDKEAEITYPDKNLMIKGSKPTSVPLWYFDEKIGTWAEEGSATLTTAGYVGKVKHFSCWNCDYQGNKVKAKGRIIDQNGNPLVGVWVGLDLAGKGYGGHGSTDAYGEFEGCIPADELLDLKVTDYRCNTPLYSQQVGPFNADVVFPDVVVTVNPSNAINIKGTLKNCANTGYRGFAIAELYNSTNQRIQTSTIQSDTFGVINYNYINVCNSPISKIVIKGYDQYNSKESLEITANNLGNVVNVGNIDVCQGLAEYLTININNNNTYTFLDCGIYPDSSNNGNLAISCFDKLNSFYAVDLVLPNGAIPPFTVNSNSIFIDAITINGKIYTISQGCKFIFTKVANVIGETYEGNIAGTVEEGGTSRSITGSFKLKRSK
jgi:hypothetical protein